MVLVVCDIMLMLLGNDDAQKIMKRFEEVIHWMSILNHQLSNVIEQAEKAIEAKNSEARELQDRIDNGNIMPHHHHCYSCCRGSGSQWLGQTQVQGDRRHENQAGEWAGSSQYVGTDHNMITRTCRGGHGGWTCQEWTISRACTGSGGAYHQHDNQGSNNIILY